METTPLLIRILSFGNYLLGHTQDTVTHGLDRVLDWGVASGHPLNVSHLDGCCFSQLVFIPKQKAWPKPIFWFRGQISLTIMSENVLWDHRLKFVSQAPYRRLYLSAMSNNILSSIWILSSSSIPTLRPLAATFAAAFSHIHIFVCNFRNRKAMLYCHHAHEWVSWRNSYYIYITHPIYERHDLSINCLWIYLLCMRMCVEKLCDTREYWNTLFK